MSSDLATLVPRNLWWRILS